MVIKSFRELRVYQSAMDLAMEIFRISKSFPPEEKYSLSDQIRRSSRSVCANIGEAWRKRRYKAAFIAKLSDSEAEACETQIWLDFAFRCNFIDKNTEINISKQYDHILSQLVSMINESEKWTIKNTSKVT